MDENKFWLCLWSMVAIAFVSLGGLLFLSGVNDTRALTDMVAKGADPIRAACAIGVRPASAAACVLQATK